MNSQFAVIAGSVTGREHLRVGKNNQDAYYWQSSEFATIAVVCDGCGSGAHSEVGAQLGARMTVQSIQRLLLETSPSGQSERLQSATFWKQVHTDVLQQLNEVAAMLGSYLREVVGDYLLFTIVGTVISPEITVVFALGDGVMIVNNEVIEIPTFPDNAPPYLAYSLVRSEPTRFEQTELQFQVYRTLPTATVQSLLIGSDGIRNLMHAADLALPGKAERVGAISQFWQNDAYFQQPDQIRRRLTLMNRDVTRLDEQTQQFIKSAGLLPDDTTLVVMRRRDRG